MFVEQIVKHCSKRVMYPPDIALFFSGGLIVMASDFGLKRMTAKERHSAIEHLTIEWWMQPTQENGWEGCHVLMGRCGLPLKRVWAGEWVGSDGTCRRQVSFACQCCGAVHTMTRLWSPAQRMWSPPIWATHEADPKFITAAGKKHLFKQGLQVR